MSKSRKGGYGKPPTKNRFKPGQSGNPSGRPKKKPKDPDSATDVIRRVLKKPVTAVRGGREFRMTAFEIILEQLVSKAVKGDDRAMKEVVALAKRVDDWHVAQGKEETPFIMQLNDESDDD